MKIDKLVQQEIMTASVNELVDRYMLIAKDEDEDAGKPKAEDPVELLVQNMAQEAARHFFETTISSTPKSMSKLVNALIPGIEKGLTQAFKNKNGLISFLENVGHVKSE